MTTLNPQLLTYFQKKISERLFIIAQHKKESYSLDRGTTCLTPYKKDSDPEWSKKFFLLLLECWKFWGEDLMRYGVGSRGKGRIRERYEMLEKMGVQFPDQKIYYDYLNNIKRAQKRGLEASSGLKSGLNGVNGVYGDQGVGGNGNVVRIEDEDSQGGDNGGDWGSRRRADNAFDSNVAENQKSSNNENLGWNSSSKKASSPIQPPKKQRAFNPDPLNAQKRPKTPQKAQKTTQNKKIEFNEAEYTNAMRAMKRMRSESLELLEDTSLSPAEILPMLQRYKRVFKKFSKILNLTESLLSDYPTKSRAVTREKRFVNQYYKTFKVYHDDKKLNFEEFKQNVFLVFKKEFGGVKGAGFRGLGGLEEIIEEEKEELEDKGIKINHNNNPKIEISGNFGGGDKWGGLEGVGGRNMSLEGIREHISQRYNTQQSNNNQENGSQSLSNSRVSGSSSSDVSDSEDGPEKAIKKDFDDYDTPRPEIVDKIVEKIVNKKNEQREIMGFDVGDDQEVTGGRNSARSGGRNSRNTGNSLNSKKSGKKVKNQILDKSGNSRKNGATRGAENIENTPGDANLPQKSQNSQKTQKSQKNENSANYNAEDKIMGFSDFQSVRDSSNSQSISKHSKNNNETQNFNFGFNEANFGKETTNKGRKDVVEFSDARDTGNEVINQEHTSPNNLEINKKKLNQFTEVFKFEEEEGDEEVDRGVKRALNQQENGAQQDFFQTNKNNPKNEKFDDKNFGDDFEGFER